MLASPAQRAKVWTGDGRTGAVIRVETAQQGRVTRRITSRPLFKRVLPHSAEIFYTLEQLSLKPQTAWRHWSILLRGTNAVPNLFFFVDPCQIH
jgi:hypothetical protein